MKLAVLKVCSFGKKWTEINLGLASAKSLICLWDCVQNQATAISPWYRCLPFSSLSLLDTLRRVSQCSFSLKTLSIAIKVNLYPISALVICHSFR